MSYYNKKIQPQSQATCFHYEKGGQDSDCVRANGITFLATLYPSETRGRNFWNYLNCCVCMCVLNQIILIFST